MLDDLKGHIVVLDFWTYCCINCMHMLPDLEWIEKKYRGRPVVVIGVHSAKFNNEQEGENITEAIGRYEISHPVIVDRGMGIWQSYSVNGWPTIAVIDPKGNLVSSSPARGCSCLATRTGRLMRGCSTRSGSHAKATRSTLQTPTTTR